MPGGRKMKVFNELSERGLIAQSTNESEIRNLLDAGGETVYTGFDATAPSLHIGSLLQIIILKRLQDAGHRPILLIGGGTTLVGDPTGRSEMRQMLDNNTIAQNTECFKKQFEHFIDFSGDKAFIVNNADWLLNLKYLPFLREVGAHFNVKRMLSAECYKQRLETGLSFLEINYMIMQGYDFLQLNDKYDCKIQLGGDDQWSNILGGVDLVRKMKLKTVYGMTFNLLTTSEGIKMGKTQKGAIWLDPDMTTPYELYQYFRNIDDKDVDKCLKFLTFLPLDQIREMASWRGSKANDAKKILAFEITKLVHDELTAKQILDSSEQIFSGAGDNHDMPTTEMSAIGNMNIIDILLAINFAKSKSDGRTLIMGGGIYLNDNRVDDFNLLVNPDDYATDEIVIRKGKKSYHKIKFVA
jgi:tyrosyl-tRNA synthetase